MEDDILGQIDWDNIFVQLPDDLSVFNVEEPEPEPEPEPPVVTDSESPDSLSSWIGDVETMLMKDDDDKVDIIEANQESYDNFFADLLVDSPAHTSGEVVDKDSEGSADYVLDKDKDKDKPDASEVNNDSEDADADADDPVSKKRRRQLRNRDAAVRSRERKKMYVRDLEMKSKYLEAECRRLGRLLQCSLSENQALRLSLQNGNAFGVFSAKQESAVLFLESLLLGSLLWFLGIMCLFILPTLPQSNLEAIPNVEKKGLGSLAPREAGSKIFISSMIKSFLKSRRCKGSRTKMKMRLHVLRVLV